MSKLLHDVKHLLRCYPIFHPYHYAWTNYFLFLMLTKESKAALSRYDLYVNSI